MTTQKRAYPKLTTEETATPPARFLALKRFESASTGAVAEAGTIITTDGFMANWPADFVNLMLKAGYIRPVKG